MKHVILALALTILVAATGCSRNNSPLVGKWKSDKGAVLEFRSDGTCRVGSGKYPADGKYTVISNTIKVQLDGDITKAFGAAEWQMAFTNGELHITARDVVGEFKVTAFQRVK